MADFTDEIRKFVKYLEANPEYMVRVEQYLADADGREKQMYADFEAIRQGTYRPKGE